MLYVGHIKSVSTLEALVSGHSRDGKKVPRVTGAGRLRELIKKHRVCRGEKNGDFVKGAELST